MLARREALKRLFIQEMAFEVNLQLSTTIDHPGPNRSNGLQIIGESFMVFVVNPVSRQPPSFPEYIYLK